MLPAGIKGRHESKPRCSMLAWAALRRLQRTQRSLQCHIRGTRRVHHTLKRANAPRRKAHMTEQDKKRKKAEQHLTDELANQAKEEPGSAAEGEAKEKRAQAEKELQDAT
jgi:hypothetical protein